VRDSRSWRESTIRLQHNMLTIRCKDFDAGGMSRLRKRVSVHTDIKRTGDLLLLSIIADGLADGQDVIFVEGFPF